jgi:transcriptional regulator with XRE-family HTH domain
MYTKHPNLIKIGKIIQELRKSEGYSQEEFASDAGLARTYMGRVERGEQNISIQNLIKIAMVLRVDVGMLIPKITELKKPK